MSKHNSNKKTFQYQRYSRLEIGKILDQINRIREEINKVHMTPVSKMSTIRKNFVLEDLDHQESFYLLKLIELKKLTEFSNN